MKIKAYAGDNIKIHHITGTEKNGITFSCILYDTYSEEQSKKIAKALRNTFTINLEEDKENNYEYKNNKNCKITINDEEIAVSEKEKTADVIKIKLKDIAKLQHLYIDIFTEEDEDYPDRRVISNKERAVQRILDRITDKRFNQIEIWEAIQVKSWDTTDNTYKPICNRLRELGYEIIN